MNRIIRRNRTYLQILTLIALVAFFLSVVATLEALGQQPSQSTAAPTVPQPPALTPKSPESLFAVKLAARDLTIAAQNVQHLVDEANKQLVQLQQQQQQRQQELDRQIQLVKQQNNWSADVEWDAAREVFVRVAKPAASPAPVAPAPPAK